MKFSLLVCASLLSSCSAGFSKKKKKDKCKNGKKDKWEDGVDCGGKCEPCGVKNDPHVITHDGHVVNIYLPVGEWTTLFSSTTHALAGRVFSRSDDATQQWFDGLRIIGVNDGVVHFEATTTHGVEFPIGPEIQFVQASLDGEELTKAFTNYSSGSLQVYVDKSETVSVFKPVTLYNDRFRVETPDFTALIESYRQPLGHKYGDDEKDWLSTHLNVHFLDVDDTPGDLTGPLADIIWGDAENQSNEAMAFRSKENALAPVVATA